MTLGRAERLRLFYERLTIAPPADSFEAALALITTTLDAIEDEHSGEPNAPERWQHLNRMFPPQADRIEPMANRQGVMKARSFRHYTLFGANGSIEIWRIGGRGRGLEVTLEFQRLGADGQGLPA